MLFQVKMDVKIPNDIDQDYIAEVKAKEKAYSQQLQRDGKWVHIWRIVGEYANISIFDVESNDELHDLLTALPLFPYMEMQVTPLAKHYSSIK
ncbi:MAG: muconolactone delta-isomerase [Crocinitomicaceae bacterium]|nr:muconolactone delta-isomerase [Crocinitomicaceae bacterium]|tara:strand:- start:332 stop:610 length:279 start_codon:yes stop_codon:yes gene_type:complete